MNKEELLKLYNEDLSTLLEKSKKLISNDVEFCSLINAKNGKCSQNCKYCAQSSHYRTDIESFSLVDTKTIVNTAIEAKLNKVSRFAIVTSGKTPDEGRDFQIELKMIKEINKLRQINSCASLGIINEEQAQQLKEAGLKRYHHNINTCKSYYPEICTTHKWDDRYNTCKLIKKYGMELCCGVILGMGETVEHRIEMALELAEIEPNSIPINILMPIKSTPFENYKNLIDDENLLRTLAVFKIANPNAILRFCGGRMTFNQETIKKALMSSVEGLMVGNYLTTIGAVPEEDAALVKSLGKTIRNDAI